MYSDAVSAYVTMKKYRSQSYAMNNSGWILLDSAEQIFKLSKERVYNAKDGKKNLSLFFVYCFFF